MAFTNVQAVILAAGKSSRLKTGKTKLVEKICGREMILYPTTLLHKLEIPITLVVGFQKELIEETIKKQLSTGITFVEQKEQLGTGHALACSQALWDAEHILVMNGDMPLVTAEIIEQLYIQHMGKNAAFSFVTAHNCEPTSAGYGRVVESEQSIQIIEAKEFTGDLSENCCINAGIYLIKRSFLEQHLEKLQKSSITGEWYITDLVKLASDNKHEVATFSASFDRIRGVNTFKELWAVEQVQKAEIIKYWMDHGVRFSIAQNVHIDQDVTIEAGSSIDSGVQLHGSTKIGKNCTIGAFSLITDTIIGDDSIIYSHTVINNSILGSAVKVGPFAHVHEKSHLEDKAVIGNFVEVKRSTIGSHSKAKHLTYLGDSSVGNNVNIGAGTITCNYDGVAKHTTTIEDNVFVGSNNTIVAPVTIKKNAFTAAGSTITEDVPADALAIARQRQTNKLDYAKKLKRQDESSLDTKDDNSSFIAATKSNTFENAS